MKKYKIIYADPAWSYKDKSKSHGGGAESHYSCMTIEEMCNMPISEIAEKDSVLFMWVTMPFLQDCFSVINAWGFTYKTCGFVWIKGNKRMGKQQLSFLPSDALDDFMGMGRWTRANAEICLIATKGKISRINPSVRQVIYAPIERHSKKPNETRERIVDLMGDLPRVELFARQNHEGWDAWGNEIENSLTLGGEGKKIKTNCV